MNGKKTVILGASTNPTRYAYLAAHRLRQHNHPIVLIGNKEGEVAQQKIHTILPDLTKEKIDTLTLYLSPKHQSQYYDYVLQMKPKRIIFNPGTENAEFMQLAAGAGIQVEVACTLVLLSTGAY